MAGTKNETIGEGDRPQLYQSLAQVSDAGIGLPTQLEFVIRTALPPEAELEPVREALRRA